MFDHRKPCDNCPFRVSQARNYQLGGQRVREIFYSEAFECHKTTGVLGVKHKPQQCAGLIALQHSEDQPNTITQAAMRLIGFEPSGIDTSDTFKTLAHAVQEHGGD